MGDRVVEVLKEFPRYLEENLSDCEKEYIKTFSRFEASVIQPHIWKFLKENLNDLCVIREFPYEEGSRKALDLALITADSQIEYGIEIKGLPLKGRGSKANDLKNHIYELGEDILTLCELLNQRKLQKQGFVYLAVSYEKEFEFESVNEEIDINKILKVSLINALIARILTYCNKKFLEKLLNEKIAQLENLKNSYIGSNEEIERKKKIIENLKYIINEEATTSKLGASATKLWDYLDSNKSISEILKEILEEIDRRQQSIFFSSKANNFLKDTDLCLRVIQKVINKYKEDFKNLEYNIQKQRLDEISLSKDLKIRNFLFVIEPI